MNSQAPAVHYLDWARRGRSGVGWYAFAIVLGYLFMFIGQVVLAVVLAPLTLTFPTFSASIMNLSLVLAFAGIPLVVRLLLRRPAWSLAVGTAPGPWLDLAVGFALMVAVLTVRTLMLTPVARVSLSAGWLWSEPATLVAFLLAAILAFFVQISAEEFLFRGLLGQFIARSTHSAWVIVGVPAVAFALPHLANVSGENPAVVLLPYLAMGILFGYAAWRSGSLWLAMGLHLGNNLFLGTLLGSAGDVLPTDSMLFMMDPIPFPAMAAISTLTSLAVTLLVHLLYRRRAGPSTR